MNYILHILIMMSIYAVITMSANMLTGLTNLISMAYAAFYGIGAYITALCVVVLHWSVIPSLLLILVVNSLLALLLALPSLRLKGDYFILATLGFQMIVYTVLYNWTKVTRDHSVSQEFPTRLLSAQSRSIVFCRFLYSAFCFVSFWV